MLVSAAILVLMSTKPDAWRLIEFQKLLLQFSQVERVVHRKHGADMRLENDTEHSYNLAMMAWYLAPYFPKLDRDTLIRYALIHDMVEVHAGDTFAYGSPEELASKHAREAAAAEKLAKEWADFPELHEHIETYEKHELPEVRFIYALDKIMPIFVIYLHEGYTWKKEGVTLAMLDQLKPNKIALSPEILPYYEELREILLKSPGFIQEK